MIEKAVKSCLETEKQLKDQMATLKKNRDNVPLDVLKTKYKKGYTCLLYTSFQWENLLHLLIQERKHPRKKIQKNLQLLM